MLLRALALAAAVTVPVLAGPALADTGSIGVPECDHLMRAYDRCVGADLAAADRAQAGAAVRRISDGWRVAAQDPASRAGLGAQCTQMSRMMSQSMATPNCRF